MNFLNRLFRKNHLFVNEEHKVLTHPFCKDSLMWNSKKIRKSDKSDKWSSPDCKYIEEIDWHFTRRTWP